MGVGTEYTRHAAKLARKIHADSALGGSPVPDAELFKQLWRRSPRRSSPSSHTSRDSIAILTE